MKQRKDWFSGVSDEGMQRLVKRDSTKGDFLKEIEQFLIVGINTNLKNEAETFF